MTEPRKYPMGWPEALVNIAVCVCATVVLVILVMVLWGPW